MKSVKKMVKNPDCKNKIYRVDNLDNIILGEIEKLSLEPELIAEETDANEKIRLIQTEIKNIDSQISRFLDLYGLGSFTVDQIDAKIKPLEERRSKLQQEISRLDLQPIQHEEVITVLDAFSDVIQNGTLEDKRELVQALISRIDLDGEDIAIRWKF